MDERETGRDRDRERFGLLGGFFQKLQVSDLIGPKEKKSDEEAELMELMRKPFVKVSVCVNDKVCWNDFLYLHCMTCDW